jgi:nitroreductase
MEFFEAVRARRSIRKFKPDPVPAEVIRKALEAAVLAPNSSNMQTWDFYWARSAEKKARLQEYCLSQSAARTAGELVVVVADPTLWKRSNPEMIKFVESVNAPKPVVFYYKKLIPATYRWGFLNFMAPIKWAMMTLPGLVRPMTRGPHSKRDIQEVSIKSAALAAENFVLACAAQGYATCMMEGFDEWRVKRLLGLGSSARVVMVIAVGLEGERGTWGPQFRIPLEQVVHEI